jgi:hypothetical protein
MRKGSVVSLAVILVALVANTVFAQAARLQPTRIALIKAHAPAYLNERVRIDGFVTQFVDSGAHSTSFFFIKDDWGSVIKVRTSKETPSVGKRYSIEGPVSIDPRSKDLYISEEGRLEIFKPVEPQVSIQQQLTVSPPHSTSTGNEAVTNTTSQTTDTATTSPNVVHPPPQPNILIYVLIGGAAVIILAIVAFLLLRSRSDEAQTTEINIATSPMMEPLPPPEQVVEGRTIKLHAPPPNTVKLLPGWFEVTSGDEIVKQIRFYKLGGEHGSETTFGRATGRPYAHIQLKAPTVSSRQAKVAFDNGSARLTNFASTESNPTRINGRDLALNETVPLRESDRVEMGEVSLLFHEAQSSAATVPA